MDAAMTTGDGCCGGRHHRSALLGLLEHARLRRMLVWLPLPVLAAFAAGLPIWVCPLSATGCRCPGCGMTRAVGALARGDLGASLALHPFAGGFVLGWLVLAAYELLGRRRGGLARAIAGVETRLPLSSLFLGAFAVFGFARLLADALGVAGGP